jgi:hypothetical protein
MFNHVELEALRWRCKLEALNLWRKSRSIHHTYVHWFGGFCLIISTRWDASRCRNWP